MEKVRIYPKESEKEWFKLNFQSSNFNWGEALKNGIVLFTYNITGINYKYKDKSIKIDIITI